MSCESWVSGNLWSATYTRYDEVKEGGNSLTEAHPLFMYKGYTGADHPVYYIIYQKLTDKSEKLLWTGLLDYTPTHKHTSSHGL